MKPYKVAAVFSIDMSEYDSVMVFLPLAEAQAYFNRADDVSAIEIFIDARPDRVDDFRRPVADAAGRPVFLVDWRRRTSAFFAALQVERNVMFLILTLIVLVAALNIVSGLIMLVKDKGSDIAILRTVGASRGAIMRVFLIAGAAIGVAGTLTGLVVGMLVCVNIEVDPAIPVLDHQHRTVSAKTLLSVETAGGGRFRRDRRRRRHGADAVVPRDALSIMARGAARSGRRAAVWMAPSSIAGCAGGQRRSAVPTASASRAMGLLRCPTKQPSLRSQRRGCFTPPPHASPSAPSHSAPVLRTDRCRARTCRRASSRTAKTPRRDAAPAAGPSPPSRATATAPCR